MYFLESDTGYQDYTHTGSFVVCHDVKVVVLLAIVDRRLNHCPYSS